MSKPSGQLPGRHSSDVLGAWGSRTGTVTSSSHSSDGLTARQELAALHWDVDLRWLRGGSEHWDIPLGTARCSSCSSSIPTSCSEQRLQLQECSWLRFRKGPSSTSVLQCGKWPMTEAAPYQDSLRQGEVTEASPWFHYARCTVWSLLPLPCAEPHGRG